MKVGSCFSGIGGLDLAAEQAGMAVAWQCELDPVARRVLTHHWPEVPCYGDIKEVDGHAIEPIDVLVGGFPCQDISVAGRRLGLAGERSGLWWEFHRLIDETRPTWVVIENVAGLLSSGGRRDLGAILGALGQLGYSCAYRVLDAQYAGVPQRRRRIIIVGYLGDWRAPAEVLLEPDSLPGNPPTRHQEGQDIAGTLGGGTGQRGWAPDTDRMTFIPILEAGARTGASTDDPRAGIGIGQPGDPMFTLQSGKQHAIAIAFTERTREGGRNLEYQEELAYTLTNPGDGGRAQERNIVQWLDRLGLRLMVRRLTPLECLRLQGFPDTFLDLDPPLKDSPKYRLIGNSVAVPVFEWVMQRIMRQEHL